MVFVDAGTVHAIGPGVVLLETQQYSDLTYRLYDYGRPRELHVDQGLAVTRTQTRAGLVEPQPMDGFARLIASDYFVVDRFELGTGESKPLGKRGEMQVLVALGMGAAVRAEGGAPVGLKPGHALVLPAEGAGYEVTGEADVPVIRIAER
jgi:mannose-6-phosphate isomerase